MEVVNHLLYGFSVALEPGNLLFCFIGVLLGTLIGVLPGIGPIGAISILLPATFRMTPVAGTIMLAGLYYGAMYGGSITSILVNIPGEAASVVTCLDGYEMAKKGRAGAALGIAAFGSFIAGTIGVVGLMLFATPLAAFSLRFGPPEYFGVILLGLTLVTYLARGSIIKAIMMGAFGICLSCVGIDAMHATPRMTFGMMQLWDGVGLIPIAMGLFGIAEVLVNIEKSQVTSLVTTKIGDMFPSVSDWVESAWAIVRGTVVGFFLGAMPGGGVAVSSFLSYSLEKKISKHPEKFGHGAIQGVAGPESANNSATAGSFIPLLTLGIPSNAIMALMFGALMIHGMAPGPFLIEEHPELFWGLISSMYIGNIMLLLLNLPLIPLWVQVLRIPEKFLFPLILLFCIIGSYSLNNSVFDVMVMFIFGVMGYLFRKFGYEGAPLLLAFVLGPLLEKYLSQSLILSRGSFLIFFSRPIAAVVISFAGIMLLSAFLPLIRGMKKELGNATEEDA